MNQNPSYEMASRHDSAQRYIKVRAADLKELKSKIEQDGFILKQGHKIYARSINIDDRFNPAYRAVFYTPFIGYYKGHDAYYIKESILNHYANGHNKKENLSC